MRIFVFKLINGRTMQSIFKCDYLGLRCAFNHCEFQVTGHDSLKKERLSRPVKIAESDADVSTCSQSLQNKRHVYRSLSFLRDLHFRLLTIYQDAADFSLTLLCALLWFFCVCF